MSMSRCGAICITPPKCIRKERGCVFILAAILLLPPAPCPGDAVFRCESESTLFGFPKEDTTRNQWLICTTLFQNSSNRAGRYEQKFISLYFLDDLQLRYISRYMIYDTLSLKANEDSVEEGNNTKGVAKGWRGVNSQGEGCDR